VHRRKTHSLCGLPSSASAKALNYIQMHCNANFWETVLVLSSIFGFVFRKEEIQTYVQHQRRDEGEVVYSPSSLEHDGPQPSNFAPMISFECAFYLWNSGRNHLRKEDVKYIVHCLVWKGILFVKGMK
jgi:hypothetical protein